MPTEAHDEADEDRRIRTGYRENFDDFNEVLVTTKFNRFLRFFNFGYEPLEGEEAPGPRLPRMFPNPDSARLLFAVVGDHDLRDRVVLEVGCGRGGNLGLLLEHAGIAHAIGTDLAFTSMAFCRRTYDADQASFFQADAESIPVADAAVDAVVNIESSGCYPDVERFYRDVARVLRPGGAFLYADLMEPDLRDRVREALPILGLAIESERDITANVARSRANRAERQLLAFGDDDASKAFLDREWVGADGSQLHEKLTGEDGVYHLFRCRRTDAAVPTTRVFSETERIRFRDNARKGAEILSFSPQAP